MKKLTIVACVLALLSCYTSAVYAGMKSDGHRYHVALEAR